MPSDHHIDVKKLRGDVAASMAKRPQGAAPNGQALSGAMAAVRKVLPVLEAMHATATWGAIADGLTAQGLRTRAGGPITGKRLTSLIASIRKQSANRLLREARRGDRSDLADSTARRQAIGGKVALAPELLKAPRAETPSSSAEVEEGIRQANFAKHSGMYKGDSK